MGEIKSLAMVGGGVLLGALGGKAIDKVLKVDETITGFNAKKFAKPAAQLGLGIVGAVKLKDPNLKMLAAGVGATGVVNTVNVITNKNLLAGIPGLGNPSLAVPGSVYEEPMQLSVGKYNPHLPQLNAGSSNYSASADYSYENTPHSSEMVDADFEII